MAQTEPVGSGWRAFAGTMIFLSGLFNLLDGIVALTNRHYLVNRLVWSDLRTWGWIMVAFGVVEILAGMAIFGGATWAAMFGIVVSMLNALGQLAFLRSFPVWSTIIIAVDVLIIYGLTAYGSTRHRAAG